MSDISEPSTHSGPSPRHDADPALRPLKPFSSLVQVDVSALSHTGLLRENNEDQFCVTRMSRVYETLRTSLPAGDVPERAEEVNYVMIVADGMGGHAAGELASRLAISALVGLALELPYWIIKLDSEEASKELKHRARALVQEVGEIVFKRGHEDASLRGMGSTLTAVRSLGRDLLVFHVGDSRAYVLRDGCLHRLTKDHTYAQVLVDCGSLASPDVAASGIGHLLTNALGGSTEHVDVDVDLVRLEHGDRVLLCSDGLSDLVDDETISRTLAGSASSNDACANLVQLALDRGGRDNVTVVVAAYSFPHEG